MPELPPDRPLPCEPQNNVNHVETNEDINDGEPDRLVSREGRLFQSYLNIILVLSPVHLLSCFLHFQNLSKNILEYPKY